MPQRFLRPGITTSIRFNALGWQAQTFYVRLLTLVDDFGRYEADLRILRSHAFPLGDYKGGDIPVKTVESICEQLSVNELAVFYQSPDGKKVLQLSRWSERPRAQTSRYPELSEDCEQMFTERRIIPRNPASLVPRSSSPPSTLRHSSNGSQANTSEPTDAEWLGNLEKSEAYQGIEVRREFSKLVEWCKTRKKQPTRRRFLNWLNRCERPIRVPGVARINAADVELPTEFREWANGAYPKQTDNITKMKTWADVPSWMREEWKRKKVAPLLAVIT